MAMIYANCARMILAVPLMVGALASSGCSMATDRPTIQVEIGMTVDELRAGSTYPFKSDAPTLEQMTGKSPLPEMENIQPSEYWMIDKPYDLIYIYKGKKLKKSDIGGSDYFIAITTTTGTSSAKKVVNSINITFQNQALTLDDALAEARALNDWFVTAGFGPPAPDSPDVHRFGPLFQIAERDRSGAPYGVKLTSYEGVRDAFLDKRARIISISPFDLAGDGVDAGLTITNARRKREEGEPSNENDLLTERTYFLNFSIYARSGAYDVQAGSPVAP